MSDTLSPMGTAALDYTRRGYFVFPITAGEKKPPLTPHGLLDATKDEGQIRKWWSTWRDANIAINCKLSCVAVIDGDVPGVEHGKDQDGRPTLAALVAELGPLPETVEAVTPGGGIHLVFSVPPGLECVGTLGCGVDIKANGYLLVWPSVRPHGAYKWRRSPLDTMPAPLPDRWLARVSKASKQATRPAVKPTSPPSTTGGSAYGRKGEDEELTKVRTAPEGDRNNQLFRSSANLAELCAGGEIGDCREALIAAAMSNPNGKPISDHEARGTCESGWRAGIAKPRPAPTRPDRTGITMNKTAPVSDITTGTPWADPEPLPDGLPPVPAFVAELLPISLRAWILDIAERLQCPVEYVAVAALSSLGSLIGRQCVVRPKRHDDWSVVANLWALLVGLPSAMKSPAMEEASRPLLRLEAEAAEVFAKEMQNAEARKAMTKARKAAIESKMLKAAKDGKGDEAVLMDEFSAAADAEEITQRRYSTSDVTIEKLGELLIENPNGLLLKCDELRGFLNSLDRDGHESARAFYLTAHDGTHGYIQDRIARGSKFIPAVCVTILGCIQPGPLAQYLLAAIRGGAGDDGFMQRFQLGVYPDVCPGWRLVDRWPNKEARDRAFDVFKRLANLSPSIVGASVEDGELPHLHFDGPAQTLFDGWFADLMNRLRAGDEHPAIEAHLTKYTKVMPGLSLILHLADGGQGAITLASAQRAAAWCDLLEAHARRIYACVTAEKLRAAKMLLAKIRGGKLRSPFTARTIYKSGWAGLSERETVEEALATLTDHGWVRTTTAEQPGRPLREYHAHPLLGVLGAANPENTQENNAPPAAQREGM